MEIKRLKVAKGLGVFRDYAAAGVDTDFCKLNLIYGFNGSGKTTLSRVFSSLERGEMCPILPEGCRFDLELSDGSTIGSGGAIDRLKGKIVVFNADFVEENFRWKDGVANPIFYIGQEQAGLASQLEAAQRRLEAALNERTTADRDFKKQADVWTKFKRDTARNISEQIGLRNYNATNLEHDYSNLSLDGAVLLDEGRKKELRATLASEAPLPKIAPLPSTDFSATGLMTLVRDARACLGQTAGTLALADLREHDSMLTWVRDGVRYHADHDLKTCLFCASPLTEARLLALQSSIDAKFDRIVADAQRLLEQARALQDRLFSAASKLPSINDIAKNQSAAYSVASKGYRESLALASGALIPIITAVERKLSAPNAVVPTDHLCSDVEASEWEAAVGAQVAAVNKVIADHNEAHDAFAQTQDSARQTLRRHYLLESQTRYREVEAQHADAKQFAERATAAVTDLSDEVDTLRQKLRQHRPAAEVINKLIQSYLRHGQIEIAALEDGFQIRRNGVQVAGTLSEGEKTAIAFCYFLSTLAAEGRRLRDLIVVVDDPISSLDTRALNYAFSVLKSHVSGAKQLFILTHNINFMNECRKWLKKKPEGKAALLFINMRQNSDGERSSSLERLPILIRDYESEYHYLFSIVKRFADSRDLAHEHLFLMPNAMRKVADVFFAFKLPGPDGLGAKIETIASGSYGIDGARLRALERLVQLESHADSLDDLVSFSSMTVEECLDCAEALMDMFAKLDREHHTHLCRLCS